MLKNKWRANLKARSCYKTLVVALEKVLALRLFKQRLAGWTGLKVNAMRGDSGDEGSDKQQLARQQIINREKELELENVRSEQNSLSVIRETLLNNQDVFGRVFADETLFGALGADEFFGRLDKVFSQADLAKDSLQRRGDVDAVVNRVTENQEIKQLINQQLEKTKVLKNKLDDIKDELFSN